MARPRNNKSFQTILVQGVLFVSLFAIAGHLSVNFWERFVIRDELFRMKTSLHTLKDTINYIGTAYDNLQRELVVLAELAEKHSHTAFKPQNEPPKSLSNKSTLDRRMFRDIEVYAAPTTANQTTQNFLHQYNKFGKIDAATGYQDHNNAVKELKDVQIGAARSMSDKIVLSAANTKVSVLKNAATITRYPLKSTAVGSKNSRSEYTQAHTKDSCRHKHILHNNNCCNNDVHSKYSSPYPFWKF